MDALPDDVLLAVLQLLPLREVVAARRVCRRWRDLALHPDLWRHRYFDGGPCSDGKLSVALRLAPCVATLKFTDGLEDFGVAVTSTACATAQLCISLKSQGDIVLAAMAVRNQAALGRLRSLAVGALEEEVDLGCGLADLFTEIHRVRGLEELSVNLPYSQPRHMSSAVVPEQLLRPSVTQIDFGGNVAQLRPHWEFQLASHAATLRRVMLNGTAWMRMPSLQASLFNGMPCLEELECPLLEDMHLLKCERLRKLCLYPDFPEGASDHSWTRTMENVMVFFRGATDLLELDLTSWNDDDSEWVMDIVAAMASSGRSKLEYLRLSKAQVDKPGRLCLERLRALKKLKLSDAGNESVIKYDYNYIPNSLLEHLAKVSLPTLYMLCASFVCFHDSLKQPALEAIMLKNPQLHIMTYALCCNERYGPLCGTCAAGGCQELGFTDGCCVGVCAHPADGDADCGVAKKHAKSHFQWFRFPWDAL